MCQCLPNETDSQLTWKPVWPCIASMSMLYLSCVVSFVQNVCAAAAKALSAAGSASVTCRELHSKTVLVITANPLRDYNYQYCHQLARCTMQSTAPYLKHPNPRKTSIIIYTLICIFQEYQKMTHQVKSLKSSQKSRFDMTMTRKLL